MAALSFTMVIKCTICDAVSCISMHYRNSINLLDIYISRKPGNKKPDNFTGQLDFIAQSMGIFPCGWCVTELNCFNNTNNNFTAKNN